MRDSKGYGEYTKLFRQTLKGSKKLMTLREIYDFAKQYGFLQKFDDPDETIIEDWAWLIDEDIKLGLVNVTYNFGVAMYYIEGSTMEFVASESVYPDTLKEAVDMLIANGVCGDTFDEVYVVAMTTDTFDAFDLTNEELADALKDLYRRKLVIAIGNTYEGDASFSRITKEIVTADSGKYTAQDVWDLIVLNKLESSLRVKSKNPVNAVRTALWDLHTRGDLNRDKIDGRYKYFKVG